MDVGLILAQILPNTLYQITFSLLFVFQAVVTELFSQFGSVESVELRDHPGSFQDSGPKLNKLFRPAEKKVDPWFLCCLQNTHTTSVLPRVSPPLPGFQSGICRVPEVLQCKFS